MTWLIGTLAATWALLLAYWCGRETGIRWGHRNDEWDRLDDAARQRVLDHLNPVDPRGVAE